MAQPMSMPVKRRLPLVDRWTITAGIIAAVVLMPLLAVVWMAFFPENNIWPHLMATSLPRYMTNSLVMMIGVAIISIFFGVSAAWLVVTKEFFGRKYFEWFLLLPLAVPAYIGAYAFVDFFEYAGPVQTALRGAFGWGDATEYYFPAIRTRGTAIFVISMSLYPYVYLLARAAYREQASGVYEVARALGCGPWGSFFRVGLPLSRPAIAIGATIVMMETLADFGTVEFFAVQTLTTGIFTVWLEASNVGGAAQIATMIFAMVLVLSFIERLSRRNMAHHQSGRPRASAPQEHLRGWAVPAAFCFLAFPVVFGFFMPVAILADHAANEAAVWSDTRLIGAVWRSALVGGAASVITLGLALILVYAVQLSPSKLPRRLVPITCMGYTAPGAVLGIGILIPMAAVDHFMADSVFSLFGVEIGLLVTGTAGAVIFAYCVRFFVLAYGALDAGFGRLSPNLGLAGRSLGLGPGAVLARIHMPMLKTSFLTAALLIFVDCIKELPATLLLRPFGFETLATHVYSFASREDIGGASVGALLIIMVSGLAVLILARASK